MPGPSQHTIQAARAIAAECWIDSGGNVGQARGLFRQRLRALGFDPITIITLVYYAVRLFMLWRQSRNQTPPAIAEAGEPSFKEFQMEIKTAPQLYATMASKFTPTTAGNGLNILSIALDVVGSVLPHFVGTKAEAMEMVAKFWDEVIVPYDIPGIGPVLERTIEAFGRPKFLQLTETLLDHVGIE